MFSILLKEQDQSIMRKKTCLGKTSLQSSLLGNVKSVVFFKNWLHNWDYGIIQSNILVTTVNAAFLKGLRNTC